MSLLVQIALAFSLVFTTSTRVDAFLIPPAVRTLLSKQQQPFSATTINNNNDNNNNEWSVTDDWNNLSIENPRNSAIDSRDIFNQDISKRAARQIQALHDEARSLLVLESPQSTTLAELKDEEQQQDAWLQAVIDDIILRDDDKDEDPSESDTATTVMKELVETLGKNNNNDVDDYDEDKFVELMGEEIAMLVRCNQSPQDLLIQQGRALAPLSKEERYDPAQLVELVVTNDKEGATWTVTPFFQQAIDTIFHQHCTSVSDTLQILDAKGVASWMTQSLGNKIVVGPHDRRVTSTISLFGTYGKGYMTQQNFQDFYLKAVVGETTNWKHLRLRNVHGVWRDLHHHDILSPVEQTRQDTMRTMNAAIQSSHHHHSSDADMLLDECEIGDDDVDDIADVSSHRTDREGISSHELVKLADDNKTPLYMNDGEFVFIDEESCIGCMQCAAAAPASFRMIGDGRARTFAQRKTPDVEIAVSTCPVNCMHYVNFKDLKELETVRDHGDGRDDHRHFGNSPSRGYVGRIPLHVSNIDSDANHRSSWYHYLKNKCQSSHQCPQRGCYDCPTYSQPGSNPYFQQHLRESYHIRAQHFMEHGQADSYRKTVEL